MSEARFGRARPLRNPLVTWSNGEEGSLRLEAPIETQGRLLRLIARMARAAPQKTFELEPVGAFVWARCDGQHTVEGIARALRESFRMNRLEADASLRAYLRTLADRGLITLLVPKG